VALLHGLTQLRRLFCSEELCVSICTFVLVSKYFCTCIEELLSQIGGCLRELLPQLTHLSAYVSIRQHTSAYVSIRQRTSAYVSVRQHTSAYVPSPASCSHNSLTSLLSFCRSDLRDTISASRMRKPELICASIRQHTSAYVSMR